MASLALKIDSQPENLINRRNTMVSIKTPFKRWPLTLIFLAFLAFSGCEGTETREKVDDTVKDLSGQKSLERVGQTKKDIDAINKQQADRLNEGR